MSVIIHNTNSLKYQQISTQVVILFFEFTDFIYVLKSCQQQVGISCTHTYGNMKVEPNRQ